MRPIEHKILDVLGDREMYGLDIAALNSRYPRRWWLGYSISGVGATLYRLECRGLIQGKWGDAVAEASGARRRYYRRSGKRIPTSNRRRDPSIGESTSSWFRPAWESYLVD